MRRMIHRRAAMHFLRSFSMPQGHRGFTVVELIACIVIIGIIAAIAGPKVFDNRPFSERGYADEIAAAIRYANNIAVASGCPTSINLSATDYQVQQHATCNGAGGWSTDVLRNDGGDASGAIPMRGNAPSGVTLPATSRTRLIFDNRGIMIGGVTPANAATRTIVVGTHSIVIDTASGLVTLQ